MLSTINESLSTASVRHQSDIIHVVARGASMVCLCVLAGCTQPAPYLPDLSLMRKAENARVLYSVGDQPAVEDGQQSSVKSEPANVGKPESETDEEGRQDVKSDHQQIRECLNRIFNISEQQNARESRLRFLLAGMTTGSMKLSIQTDAGADTFRFVFVPTGEFTMGRSERDARNANVQSSSMHHAWSQPEHRVRMTAGYFLGEVEVSRESWTLYQSELRKSTSSPDLKNDPSDHERHNIRSVEDAHLPVVNITWFEAVAFCRWLSAKTGFLVRLPSETEFEWAARGPGSFVYSTGDGKLPEIEPVESLRPCGSDPEDISWCGARDLAGNAREWCLGPWEEDLYQRRLAYLQKQNLTAFFYRPSLNVPDTTEQRRVIRGGDSINDPAPNQQAATRRFKLPDTREPTLGFRLVIPIDPESPF